MRYLILAFACCCALAALAADISGKIIIKGNPTEMVKAGYNGVGADGKDLSNFAGTGFNHGDAEVTCTTYAPRNTNVKYAEGKGGSYSHSAVPPGQYVVFAMHGETYLTWAKVTVFSPKEMIFQPLTMDLNTTGALKITRKGGAKTEVTLVPLDANKKPLIPGVDLAFGFGANVQADLDAPSKTIKGLKPGNYQIIARVSYQNKPQGIVTIVTGKTATITVP